MKKLLFIIPLTGLVCLLAFRGRQQYLPPVPAAWPKPAYNFRQHPLSEHKVALGRRLFNDPLLSRDGTISCSSCHLQYTAFTHIDHNLSHGIEGRIGSRNSPALMNLAWSKSFMWDGAITHLDEQAQVPITNPLEMDDTMEHVVARLQAAVGYPQAFATAFGDTIVTAKRLMEAMSQFMLTLVSANSKYDKVIAGEAIFSERENHGYLLFKEHCATCHTEPLFTNGAFEYNGLLPDPALNDIGRMKVTGKRSDSLKFKVPTLRNIEVTYPYMHDGRFRNLQMVLFHYNDDIKPNTLLSHKLNTSKRLSEQDKSDIILFLKTLTDEEFLRNKNFSYTKNQN
ncbi:MAG: cytochrome c peroxidase [Bacteroidota bacterium]